MDGLPLALDQAGAFLEETRCGLSDYLQLYQTRQAELLIRRGTLVVDHPDPVATTWSLSFEKVATGQPGRSRPVASVCLPGCRCHPGGALQHGSSRTWPRAATGCGGSSALERGYWSIIDLLLRAPHSAAHPQRAPAGAGSAQAQHEQKHAAPLGGAGGTSGRSVPFPRWTMARGSAASSICRRCRCAKP